MLSEYSRSLIQDACNFIVALCDVCLFVFESQTQAKWKNRQSSASHPGVMETDKNKTLSN